MMLRRLLVLFFFLLSCSALQAQLFLSDMQKGYKALEKNNYDRALEIFNGIEKGDSADAGASYGIAEIYFSKNYSGYSISKAYKHIRIAQENFGRMSKKQIASLAKLDIDQSKIDQLREKIDDELFSEAVSENSTAALDEFIRAYPDNANLAQAKELRSQLQAMNTNSSNSEEAINNYIKSNPNSKDVKRAISMRDLLAFQKAKTANTAEALKDFISKHPDAEQIDEAMQALATIEFELAKSTNTIAAYDTFMVRYPESEEFAEATKQRNQLAYIQILELQKAKDKAELEKTNNDLERQGMWTIVVVIGSVCLLILLAILYRGYNQKKRSNIAITHQKEIIEQKNKEIVDSINYAKRIQDSMLPVLSDIKKSLPDSFVFFRPRNIVSGDFYWFTQIEDKLFVAAADCTGHGVPGALVSMIGFNFLNQLVIEMEITDPGEILNRLHAKISSSLNKESSGESLELRDGMDIALLCIDQGKHVISYAGAVRPLYYLDEEGLKSIKGGFYSIGGIKSVTEDPFITHTVKPVGKAAFYLFSDGFADQFGGPNGKKFKMKQLQELLVSMRDNTMDEQHAKIESVFVEWMGNNEQVDDVCVIGIRV